MQHKTKKRLLLFSTLCLSLYYDNRYGAHAIHLINHASVEPLQNIATSSNKTDTKENVTDKRGNVTRRKTLKPIMDMRLYEKNASAQMAACKALTGMAFVSHDAFTNMKPLEVQNTIMEDLGDVQAIKAMKKFPNDVQLQIACMDMLGSLARWNPSAFLAMGKHGAIEVMAGTLKRFPHNMQVQKMCGGLGSFTDFNSSVASENLKKIEKTGVTPTILNALDEYSHDGSMVMPALGFSSNACLSSKLKKEMIKHGSPVKFVALMQAYANTTSRILGGVRGEVIGILERCFMDSSDICDRMVNAGLIEAIVGTMIDATKGLYVDVMGNTRMQKNSMSVIRQLVQYNMTYKNAIVKAGAVNQILDAINFTLAKPRPGCLTAAALVGRSNLPKSCIDILNKTDEYIEHLKLIHQKRNMTSKEGS